MTVTIQKKQKKEKKYLKRLDYIKKWKLRNKEKVIAYRKKYELKNHDKILKTERIWKRKNKKRLNVKAIKYNQQYRQMHPWIKNYRWALERCNYSKHKSFHRYGGRGIKFLMTVADFKFLWFRDKAHLMKCPSIDRIDNNDNYTLNNCHFIEKIDNSRKH